VIPQPRGHRLTRQVDRGRTTGGVILRVNKPPSRLIGLDGQNEKEGQSRESIRRDEVRRQRMAGSPLPGHQRRTGTTELVVLDTTGNSHSVSYELGYCHVIDRPPETLVLLRQEGGSIPFNCSHFRHLRTEISSTLRGCYGTGSTSQHHFLPGNLDMPCRSRCCLMRGRLAPVWRTQFWRRSGTSDSPVGASTTREIHAADERRVHVIEGRSGTKTTSAWVSGTSERRRRIAGSMASPSRKRAPCSSMRMRFRFQIPTIQKTRNDSSCSG